MVKIEHDACLTEPDAWQLVGKTIVSVEASRDEIILWTSDWTRLVIRGATATELTYDPPAEEAPPKPRDRKPAIDIAAIEKRLDEMQAIGRQPRETP